MHFLSISGVSKTFETKKAVDNIHLDINEGCIYGLLGPNGAGKTTLIRMITRIIYPDSGHINMNGKPITDEHQELIGYMPEERGLYQKMKVGEQVEYLLALRGMSTKDARNAANHWFERFDLTAWRNRKVQELSKGMQQKVQFIQTIAHKPKLLILDEPFSGLDPINARLIQDIIFELKEAGTTILFSTHRLESVEEICEQMALVNNGRVVLEGAVRDTRLKYRKHVYELEADEGVPATALPAGLEELHRDPYSVRVKLPESMSSKQLLDHVGQHVAITRFEHYLPDLRDIFIEVVGKSLREIEAETEAENKPAA